MRKILLPAKCETGYKINIKLTSLEKKRAQNMNTRILNYGTTFLCVICLSCRAHQTEKRNEPEVVSHCNIEFKYLKN